MWYCLLFEAKGRLVWTLYHARHTIAHSLIDLLCECVVDVWQCAKLHSETFFEQTKISFVWEIFSKLSNDKVQCSVCHTTLAYKQRCTSELKRHAERRHEDFVKRVQTNKEAISSIADVNNVAAASKSPSSSTSTTSASMQQPTSKAFMKLV